MHLNTKKTKEMSFTLCKRIRVDECVSLRAGSEVIERVQEFKIIGLILSSDLTWTSHVKYIVAKANKRLYAICQFIGKVWFCFW